MNPILLKSLIGVGVVGGSAGLAIGGHYLFKSSEPTTLKESFQRKNVQILDYWTENISDNSESGNYAEWNGKVTKYNSSANKFEGLDNVGSSDLNSLRNKCKEVLEKPISETKNLESKAKEWCTKATP